MPPVAVTCRKDKARDGSATLRAPGTYWAARGSPAEGPVDAVGAVVQGAGVAEVVAGDVVSPPQGGVGDAAVGTLAALPV